MWSFYEQGRGIKKGEGSSPFIEILCSGGEEAGQELWIPYSCTKNFRKNWFGSDWTESKDQLEVKGRGRGLWDIQKEPGSIHKPSLGSDLCQAMGTR